MDKLVTGFRSFVHSLTTNDHYATYESQYKNSTNAETDPGRTSADHLPLTFSGDSTSGNHLSYSGPSSANQSSTSLNTKVGYTPGMRSSQAGNGYLRGSRQGADGTNAGSGSGIQMLDYSDGVIAPPSVQVSWDRIERWLDSHYPELLDQLSYPVTGADLNELESDLDCTLPLEVRNSYLIHDGQERGGRPCGLIFGLALLGLEEIAEEWSYWKAAALKVNASLRRFRSAAAASAGSSTAPPPRLPPNMAWLERQTSVPEDCVQKVYAHPGWIPLAKDFEGNNIAIDLAPGPKGRWGQVILFGRDFDTKYVIASSWAVFLSNFADDLEGSRHMINQDLEEGELIYRHPKTGQLLPYLRALRMRVDQLVRANRAAAASPPAAGSSLATPMPLAGLKKPASTFSSRTSSPSASQVELTSAVPPSSNASAPAATPEQAAPTTASAAAEDIIDLSNDEAKETTEEKAEEAEKESKEAVDEQVSAAANDVHSIKLQDDDEENDGKAENEGNELEGKEEEFVDAEL